MDPITHAVMGTIVAAFSGNDLSISDPVYLGAILGSIVPDLDIVCQIKGDLAYLKNHRGFSHSILGLGIFAAVISFLLILFYPQANFKELFLWTFLGSVSHSVLDILNSYGAKILWPFYKKKINLGILTIFDPLLLLFMLATIISFFWSPVMLWYGSGVIVFYLLSRYFTAIAIGKILFKRYGKNVLKIIVLPAQVSIWNWHYLIEYNNKLIVGEFKLLVWKHKVKKIFKKQKDHPIIKVALESRLGKMFREFTPIFYVFCKKDKNGHNVEFIDLRYLLKGEFMHTATAFIDGQQKLIKGIFHPYSRQKNIKIIDISGS